MNLKEIKEMINLMNENNLTELEVERDGLKIRLKKGRGVEVEGVEGVEEVAPPLPQKAPPAEERVGVKREAANIIEIKAPMVGTFYRAPSPDAEPFVEVGSKIEEDQVICIIEAMKLMNEIKSGVKGKVLEVLVENGEAVEFDQPLFRVEVSQ